MLFLKFFFLQEFILQFITDTDSVWAVPPRLFQTGNVVKQRKIVQNVRENNYYQFRVKQTSILWKINTIYTATSSMKIWFFFLGKRVISIHVNLRYLRMKLLKCFISTKENKKCCDTFDQTLKSYLYVLWARYHSKCIILYHTMVPLLPTIQKWRLTLFAMKQLIKSIIVRYSFFASFNDASDEWKNHNYKLCPAFFSPSHPTVFKIV